MAGSKLRLAALVLLGVVACDYGQVTFVPPPPAPVGPLTLVIQADTEDAAPAQELQWSSGIPDAVVTLRPYDPALSPLTGQADETGRISLAQATAGPYTMEAHRWLSAGEVGRLAPAEDVIGFATVQTVWYDGSGAVHTVFARASRRHSLIISEFAFSPGYYASVGDYVFGGFLELYNNADTTIYLDGIIIGEGFAQDIETAPVSCAQATTFSDDPQGVWTHFFQALPGSGRDYPMAPGRVVVIATDAIDHRPIFPNGLDLSRVDFDFSGPADVVNPGVPEVIDIGVAPDWFGHGLIFSAASNVPVVALPVDVSTLPRKRDYAGWEWVRIPRDRVLDVLASRSVYAQLHGYTECPLLVHPNFDRREARLLGTQADEFVLSVARKVAFVRPDGRKILQHTRTGASDWFVGPRTPGVLP